MGLVQNLENIIKKERLLQKGDSFVIGVSGGVDSICLLYCLNELKKTWNFKIHVAHLDHGFRKDSSVDAENVRSIAKKYKLPFYHKKITLPRSNVEEAGRIARYEFFEDVRKQAEAKYIVTAHNLNDNAETILLNLTRGAGLSGLSGMKLKEKHLIRPLLLFKKEEILAFAKEKKLRWREDPSNNSLKFSRNRIRHKVLPELLKINEKAEENIIRSASIIKETDDHLKEEALSYVKTNLSGHSLDLTGFKKLKTIQKKEILKAFIRKTKGNITNLEQSHLEALLELTEKTGTKEAHLPSGLIVTKEYDKLSLEIQKASEKRQTPKTQALNSKKTVYFSNFSITATPKKKAGKTKEDSVYIDEEKTGSLFVRCRKAGDRIYISKDKTKKLTDLFIDKKIPLKKRDSYPIVVSENGEIVWVPRVRTSEKFRAKEGSGKTTNLKVKT